MLSAILVVRNEEKKIRRCLESISWADEITVIDQSSCDRTAVICREFTKNVTVVGNKGYCEPDRMLAVEKSAGDWIFYIDADEVVSEELSREIKRRIALPDALDAYSVQRRNFIFGRPMHFGGHQNDRQVRLFKRGKVEFCAVIHSQPLVRGSLGRLDAQLLHYCIEDLNEYVIKMNAYTDAALLHAGRQRRSRILLKSCLMPCLSFFRRYVFLQGFRDGTEGFIYCMLCAYYEFAKYAKQWETTLQKIP